MSDGRGEGEPSRNLKLALRQILRHAHRWEFGSVQEIDFEARYDTKAVLCVEGFPGQGCDEVEL
jgi:hypothetical protein